MDFNDWWDELLTVLKNEGCSMGADKFYWSGYYKDGYTPYGAFIEEECIDG